MSKRFDVGIIGASISGSFAAYLLARRGYSVALIDPREVGKVKACGEGLSKIGQRYLDHAGLWDERIAEASRPFYGYTINFEDGSSSELVGKKPIGYALGRSTVDQHVLNAARQHPNLTLIRERVMSAERVGQSWHVNTASQGSIEVRELIQASGLGGRKIFNEPTLRTPTKYNYGDAEVWEGHGGRGGGRDSVFSQVSPRYGITVRARGRWRGTPPRTVIVKQCKSHQFVLTPCVHQQINLCAFVSAEPHSTLTPDRDQIVQEALLFASESGFLITECEDVRGAASISSSVVRNIQEGLYCIGDAAEVFDPIGGMGMSHGLCSASLAAEAISHALQNPNQSETIWARFLKRRDRISWIFRFKTWVSYQMNVHNRVLLKKASSIAPRFSLKLLAWIEDLSPVVGLARAAKSSHRAEHDEHSPLAWAK